MPQWLSFTTRVPNFCIVWIFCKIWSETDHRHMTCLDFDHPTWVNTRCYYATPDVSVKVWSEIKILLTSALSKHSTLPLQRWNQISVTCALKMPFFASFFFFALSHCLQLGCFICVFWFDTLVFGVVYLQDLGCLPVSIFFIHMNMLLYVTGASPGSITGS